MLGQWKTSRTPVAYSPPVARVAPAPRTVTVATVAPTPTVRATFIPYYDPSRIFDIDKIKVVADVRQQGTERGETQTGDNGILGPESGKIAPPRVNGGARIPATAAQKNLVPIALAIAAFVLLGG